MDRIKYCVPLIIIMNIRISIPILFLGLAVLYFSSLDRIALTDPDEVFYSRTAEEIFVYQGGLESLAT